MRLTREDIENIAYLSRLKLSDEENENLTEQINRLFESVEKLQELETDDVEPTSHVIPVFNVFRKDEVTPSLSREDALANGPEVADGCFVVPRIVET